MWGVSDGLYETPDLCLGGGRSGQVNSLPSLSGALTPPASTDRGPRRVFKLLWWETLIPRWRAVKWPDAAPSGSTTGWVPLVLVRTVNVIPALRHCKFQAPTSTFLHLQPGPCQRWRMIEITGWGRRVRGKEVGRAREGGSLGAEKTSKKTSGKLEAAQDFKPPHLLHLLMKLHLQNTAHEGCGLWIEWKGKSIV